MDNQIIQTQVTEDYDIDYEYPEWEEVGVECPDCGSHTLWSMPRATSPDDYTIQTECRNCGSTFES